MNTWTLTQIYEFLQAVDKTFPVPLSEKQDLSAFAEKLAEKATLCGVEEQGELLSLVAGYTENLTDGLAYISIVATKPEGRGKGYASHGVREFMEICRQKKVRAVHLYAVRENTAAVRMYQKLGFTEWKRSDEPRPADLHLIYYFD